MRKSRKRLYRICLYAAVVINVILMFFVFPEETKVYRAACWQNPWFGIVQLVICWGLLVASFMGLFYEYGRDRGIREAEHDDARRVREDHGKV